MNKTEDILLIPKLSIPNKEDLLKSHQRIKPFINNTPILTSSTLNKKLDCQIFFKCENFQKMGAFKMSASNCLLKMDQEKLSKGVATHSSGNFAQAVALIAKMTNTKANIVMPTNAPKVKKMQPLAMELMLLIVLQHSKTEKRH